jgi:hypothetical protein
MPGSLAAIAERGDAAVIVIDDSPALAENSTSTSVVARLSSNVRGVISRFTSGRRLAIRYALHSLAMSSPSAFGSDARPASNSSFTRSHSSSASCSVTLK